MQLRLPELQKSDPKVKQLKNRDLLEGWKDVEDIF